MSNVCLEVRAVDQYVIEEHKYKISQVMLEYVILEVLERRGSIGKSKWHYQLLEMATEGSESCLVNVLGLHPDLVVARPQVKFGEDMCPMQLIRRSSMMGIENLFLIVCPFNIRESTQSLCEVSFLLTKIIGEA
jgi:hypothetical protein